MAPIPPTHGPLPKIPEGQSKLKLGALIYDEMDLLDIMGPMRIFGEALTKLDIEICFISHDLQPVRTCQQVKFTPHYTLDNAPKMDIFFMPGGPGTLVYMSNDMLLSKVRARIEAATWCFTVCTGSAILAKTGLVDGYNLTTNKAFFEMFTVTDGEAPAVNWIKKARWVQDGKYVTSSGVSAGIDAALYFISELTSMENAESISQYIEYSWHKDAGEDPFAEMYPYTRS